MNLLPYWCNLAALFLLLVWLLQRVFAGPRGLPLCLLCATLLCMMPFFGHAPRYWLSGLTPNASVPLLALLSIGILQRGGIGSLFRPAEWRAAWIFGAVAAILLYPSALGLCFRNFDSYSLGWPWSDWTASLLLFGVAALTAAIMVWRNNRFGWVLVLVAVAFCLGIQESSNFWDYLIDPLYATVSLVACSLLLLRSRRKS